MRREIMMARLLFAWECVLLGVLPEWPPKIQDAVRSYRNQVAAESNFAAGMFDRPPAIYTGRYSMCFSAEASYTAAAILLPAGVVTIRRAFKGDRRYLPLAALPLFFGLQQLSEGLLWTSADKGFGHLTQTLSLIYMFFTWFAWPVWVPFSAYFLEPCARRNTYLAFSILGGIVGAMQFIPYFAHDGWLVVRFLPNAISYEGTVLFDFIMPREITYAVYMFAVAVPLITSSKRELRFFGLLVLIVLAITYAFFRYAYISVFCFGGAVISLYLVYAVLNANGGSRRGLVNETA